MIRIEPDWNVKSLLKVLICTAVYIRIEPDWNVKWCAMFVCWCLERLE